MALLQDKGILWLMGFCLLRQYRMGAGAVIAMLLALTVTGLLTYFLDRKRKVALIAVYFAACVFLPEMCSFLPLIFYDCAKEGFLWSAAGLFLCIRCWAGGMYASLWFLFAATAVLLALQAKREERLKEELIRMRDASTEHHLALKEKNRSLMERQNYEIHVATLRERNRIAREIHDNVGHMLSRSILQVGALLTLHREEPLHGQLGSVNDTLNQAMTSIRESVHDLHDDAVDLQQVILEILAPMRDSYEIAFEYDMSRAVERDVKYCFIMAVKEAMSNVIKHSDATRVSVMLREQPSFYQLLVEDNGTVPGQTGGCAAGGIGLASMQERVETLGGIFRAENLRAENLRVEHPRTGFKIFISVPKRG